MFSFGDAFSVGMMPLLAAMAVMMLMRNSGFRPQRAWPTALALGYICGQTLLDAQGKGLAAIAALLQPHLARDWLPSLIMIALVALWIASNRPVAWWSLVVALAVSTVVPLRLLWQSVYIQSQWTPAEIAGRCAAIAIALCAVWMAFTLSRSIPDSRLRAVLLTVVALATSLTLLLSGARVYGLLGGAATSALVGTVLWPLAGCDSSEKFHAGLTGGGPALAVILGALLVLGLFYAELTAFNAALLTVAMAIAATPLPTWQPYVRVPCRALGVLAPAAVAVIQAAQAFAAALAQQAAYQ